MKITIELESDAEKENARRFLDDDSSPQIITVPDSRFNTRLLIALRQYVTSARISKQIQEGKRDT